MKIVLYVFSGTGNTLKIANAYAKEFDLHDVTIYLVKDKNHKVPDPNEFDLIGFGYPIHAFNTPEIFYRFVKSLPHTNHKATFIFKTSGEPLALNNSSSQKFLRLLSKRGYSFLCERHYVMPYNIITRHSDAFAKQMWIYAQGLVKVNAQEILTFKQEKVKKIFLKNIHTFIFRIEWIYAKIQGPTFHIVKDKCSKCYICLKNCPTNNISIKNDQLKFHSKCALCMRCVFECPQDAIKIGLLNGWKVNGNYNLDAYITDASIPFPYLPHSKKIVNKIYGKYFSNADKILTANNINLNDFMN